jgi:hypothetical protein
MSPERIARLLPAIYRQGAGPGDRAPLGPYLAAMAGLHQPTEAVLDRLHELVDPLRTDEALLPMLSFWLDLDRYLDWPGGRPGEGAARFAAGNDRWRMLLAAAPRLRRERGRSATLIAFLELATGVAGFAVIEGGRPFHARIEAPAAAGPFRGLVARIVAAERPAYVTYELVFTGERTDA